MWLGLRSVGDAGAARAARADRPSPAVPLSLRLLGPFVKSPASPSHRPRHPRRAPEAGGGPRSPGKLARGSARLTAATAPRWGRGGAWRAGAAAGGSGIGRPAGVGRETPPPGGPVECRSRPPARGEGGGWRGQRKAGFCGGRRACSPGVALEPFLSSSLFCTLTTPVCAPGPLRPRHG